MLERAAYYLQKGIFPASRVVGSIGVGLLIVLVLLTVADVVLRRFFDSPIRGYLELTEFILGIIVFLTLAYCAVQGGHIVVDVLVSRFPQRTQASIGAIVHFCSAGILGLISWQLFLHAMRVRDMGEISAILGIWLYPFVFIAALGTILLAMVFLIQSLYALAEVRKQ